MSTEAKKKYPAILETEYWIVYLNFKQEFLGRSVIVLKREAGNLSEVTANEWQDLQEVIKTMEAALKKVFNPSMFNWACLMNNAYQEPEPKPQVHFHVWLRYKGPVTFEGMTFTDEYFGHYIPGSDKSEEFLLPEDTHLKIISTLTEAITND